LATIYLTNTSGTNGFFHRIICPQHRPCHGPSSSINGMRQQHIQRTSILVEPRVQTTLSIGPINITTSLLSAF
jgi:hypothetical protein